MIQFNYPRILPIGENAVKRKTLRLYMYVTADALFAIIKTGRLKLSHPWKTNDITECLAQYEVGLRYEIKQYGYLCFSADPSSPAMWGYYAERGNGACLVFDFDVIEVQEDVYELVLDGALDAVHPVYIRKVKYCEQRCPHNTQGDEFFCKSKEWEHEQEYRIVFDLDNDSVDVEDIQGVGSISLAHYYSGLMDYLSGVILGPKFKSEDTEIKSYLHHCFSKKTRDVSCNTEKGSYHLLQDVTCNARYAGVVKAALDPIRFTVRTFNVPYSTFLVRLKEYKKHSPLGKMDSVGFACGGVVEAALCKYFQFLEDEKLCMISLKVKDEGNVTFYLTKINGLLVLLRECKSRYLLELDYPEETLERLYAIFKETCLESKVANADSHT